jgi:integrase
LQEPINLLVTPKSHPQTSGVESTQKSTRQHLEKIPGVAGLYRHDASGIYHLQLTSKQRKVRKSLKTTDRKTAERKLAIYKAHLGKTDPKKGSVTLSSLVDSYLETLGAKAASTHRNQKSVLTRLTKTWPQGRNHKVTSITGGDLDKWLSIQFGKLRPRTYNTYSGFLKSLLDHAVALKVIGANPYYEARNKRRKNDKVKREVPTLEQFQKILSHMRSNKFNPHGEESADFIEFLGSAAVGQAEAGNLRWRDVDFEKGRIIFHRQKTKRYFHVPIFKNTLLPLLKRRKALLGREPGDDEFVFSMNDGKKGLAAATKALGLPRYSQRDLRAMRITDWVTSNINVKMIAQWQGHSDGGILIMNTYSDVISDSNDAAEREAISRLENR